MCAVSVNIQIVSFLPLLFACYCKNYDNCKGYISTENSPVTYTKDQSMEIIKHEMKIKKCESKKLANL